MTHLVARKLAALALTAVLAPALSYLVFSTLQANTFAPEDALRDLGAFMEGYLLHGDLGFSAAYGLPVVEVLLEGVPVDLGMLASGFAFGLAIGSAAGVAAAARPRGLLARALHPLAAFAISAPVYWLGFVALLLFGSNTGLLALPFVSGAGEYRDLPDDPLRFVQAMWVPCVIVGLPVAASVYRMTLSSTREVLGLDYVRTGYAKGLRTRVVLLRHVLPVAGPPGVVLAASQVNLLIANVALIQSAFNIPGTFRNLTQILGNRDLSMLQGMIVEGALLIALANTLADLWIAWRDPRVRA